MKLSEDRSTARAQYRALLGTGPGGGGQAVSLLTVLGPANRSLHDAVSSAARGDPLRAACWAPAPEDVLDLIQACGGLSVDRGAVLVAHSIHDREIVDVVESNDPVPNTRRIELAFARAARSPERRGTR
jgi:hypothetical protein